MLGMFFEESICFHFQSIKCSNHAKRMSKKEKETQVLLGCQRLNIIFLGQRGGNDEQKSGFNVQT